jgi:putative inorganic carbon (hco3(-)) transporter
VNPQRIEDQWPLYLAPLLPLALLGLLATGTSPGLVVATAVAGVLVIAALYVATAVDVAWVFSASIALTLFSGHWRELGFPNLISPDRLLLLVGIIVFLLRDPALGRRPYVRLTPTHFVLVLAAALAICSGVAAGTIGEKSTLFPLLDRFGIIPFLLFTIAPAAFATERQRRILAGTLLAVGVYLSLTSILEGLNLDGLLFPHYLAEMSGEVQAGRARGPFLDAAVNGLALFNCAIASLVGYVTFAGKRARTLALAVAGLCIFALIFTQERSVWVGAVAGLLCAGLASPQLRRRLPLAALAIVAGIAVAFVLVPGLQQRTVERIGDQRTEWDRLNLNKAAENMIEARPLFGFGLGTFQAKSPSYFEQNQNFPLTNTGGELHNVFLSTAAELGLVGVATWVLALFLAVGGAIIVRGPPELYPWRIGLIAIAVMWLVVANLTPLVQGFPNQLLWLWAGVVWPWRYALVPAADQTEPKAAARTNRSLDLVPPKPGKARPA